jgi:hypothetical protein
MALASQYLSQQGDDGLLNVAEHIKPIRKQVRRHLSPEECEGLATLALSCVLALLLGLVLGNSLHARDECVLLAHIRCLNPFTDLIVPCRRADTVFF